MINAHQYRNGIVLFGFSILFITVAAAQDTTQKMVFRDSAVTVQNADSLAKTAPPVTNENRIDSIMKHHSPRKAAIRSAIIPGWGQIYNKKYWKLPIVYGALGVSGAVFNYNLQWYRRTRFAYKVLVTHDTANYDRVYPLLRPLFDRGESQALRSYRDEFRKNIDYSAILFILLWGLNVVDATVDAHLKAFDVSPDLTFRLQFGRSQMAGTTGASLVLAFK